MTTPRLPRRKQTKLSFRWRRWLLSGRPAALWYLERDHCELLWREYGGKVVARHVARWPLSRPHNWWRLDAVAPRRDGETSLDYLIRHELLTPREKRALGRRRRLDVRLAPEDIS